MRIEIEIQELLSSMFRFGNYNAEIPFTVFMDDNLLLQWIRDNHPIGYCRQPQYKPTKNYVAILFDLDEQGEYWSHIPERVFNNLIMSYQK